MEQRFRKEYLNTLMLRWGTGMTLIPIVVWGTFYLIFGYFPETPFTLSETWSPLASRWTDVFLGLWVVLCIWILSFCSYKSVIGWITFSMLIVVTVVWICLGLPLALIALCIIMLTITMWMIIISVAWLYEKLEISNFISWLIKYMLGFDVLRKQQDEKKRLKREAKRKKKNKER